MAKALLGYLDDNQRTRSSQGADNARLRARVIELEALVLRLSQENDRLLDDRARELLERSLEQMQPV